MILILVLVAVALAAYYLARRDVDKKTVEATRGISSKAVKVGGDLQSRVKDLTGQNQGKPKDFIAWATGPGKQNLPEDFNTWFAGLDSGEKKSFSKALASYVDGLGLSLAALTSGRLDKQPDFKSVFVETLVIYSSAYRKIAEAKAKPEAKAESTEAVEDPDTPAGEIKPAEKARSRRGSDSPLEAAPAAT
jgi:hypothetical protein